MLRITRDALDGANLDTLRRVKMPYALGALHRIDFVKFNALINGLVGTLRLTDVTIDAFLGDLERQGPTPSPQTGAAWPGALFR